MEKFLIVDGNSLANRAYYAMPYLSNIKAEPSGAVFGFANIFVLLLQNQKINAYLCVPETKRG